MYCPAATQCRMMHNLITRALARDARHLLLKAQCSLQRLTGFTYVSKHQTVRAVQGYQSKQKTHSLPGTQTEGLYCTSIMNFFYSAF